ncbi:response regulator transcription factor [Caldalkalibacillus salinus]|uniref:response regulator transcription factor n=1 Tax=Caldalkalibacillus salinus TaxID=2803787 RepID=UPI00192091C0|nr:response regulator transcription factor [Caldalkalibacillus salinus]
MNRIKILLVEDDPTWLQCLTDYIHREVDLTVTATATNKAEAIRLATSIDVDVMLIDINLMENELDGIEVAAEILEHDEQAKIIMLTNLEDVEVIKHAIAEGVDNYITKNHYKDIPKAVRDAYHDQSSIHASIAKKIKQEIRMARKKEFESLLTRSEKEVLTLVSKGKTKKQIQELLFITESTIKKHLNKVFKKLGVSRSQEAVKEAIKKGIIDKPSRRG